jgi:hypothetical protein
MNSPVLALDVRQASLFEGCPITAAVSAMALAGVEERGAIFTRREVVDFILDLSGYTSDKPLASMRLLEPSFGDGDFLLPAIERLLVAWKQDGSEVSLADSVRAVELHKGSFMRTRQRVHAMLSSAGLSDDEAIAIIDRWFVYGDFLLAKLPGSFDVVIGNPPYVRQELIPDILMAEYRARYTTIYDRADIYIPFIERSLSLLKPYGRLGFICADRWMKNRYGGPLRKFVSENFHLSVYVDMVDTPAFHSDVIAYPAITIITREQPGATRIAARPDIAAEHLASLTTQLLSTEKPAIGSSVRETTFIVKGSEPWILHGADSLALVRRLEEHLPTLEEAGCKVRIGVATGADKAFIGKFDDLDVEDDRKLPLAMTRDIHGGQVAWRGYGVINPFADSGKLVELAQYPKLRAYLEARKDQIAGRHVAQKAPANWYRTIDRIYPEIAAKPKLLIPDIKGEAHIVYENDGLYPHHNLYFITSDSWDVRALQAILMSGIARLFVSTYSTKMRGGYLRFQAQYLRRIRIPHWHSLGEAMQQQLIAAAQNGNRAACNELVFRIYGLTSEEIASLEGTD